MQNQPPSAPPMDDVDGFEWVPNNNNHNGDNHPQSEHSLPVQGFIQPPNMAIPDAITQQLIYHRIMQQQQQHRQQQPQPPQPAEQKVNPKTSYLADTLKSPATSLYQAASLCIWRPKSNGKGIQLMMGVQRSNDLLALFGGPRDPSDQSAVDAAMRVFHQQTCHKLDAETLTQIRQMLFSDTDRRIFWKHEWLRVWFYYQMSFDYEIVANFARNNTNTTVMKSLHWIDFAKLYKSVYVTGTALKIGAGGASHSLQDEVVGFLLHEQNRKYLIDLHAQYGGDMALIAPKFGGRIRQSLTAFTQLPKAIRLDVLSPLTHTILYNRWLECDVLREVDDVHVLCSMVNSVCPEISGNFLLYFTGAQSFKHSTQQFAINTIPAFKTLQTRLRNSSESVQLVTRLHVLPTFVVSEQFKGVSFACRAQHVSWKTIQPQNDEEKAPEDWRRQNDDSEQVDEEEENGVCKWQFMNEHGRWQDFDAGSIDGMISAQIESAFVAKLSFMKYERNHVSYQVNFKKMCQCNLSTQTLRSVRRVPLSVPSDVGGGGGARVPQPKFKYFKWEYQDETNTWMDYDASISKQLNALRSNYDSHSQPALAFGYFGGGGARRYSLRTKIKSCWYVIDVQHYTQQNENTKKQRKIRQIAHYDHENSNYNRVDMAVRSQWQFEDGATPQQHHWRDFESAVDAYMERQFTSSSSQFVACAPFVVTATNGNNYKIDFGRMQQQCVQTGRYRRIRRIPRKQYHHYGRDRGQSAPPSSISSLMTGLSLNGQNGEWQWQDNDNVTWRKYDAQTSAQIEQACNAGIRKYFFVSSKNKNSYEINFATLLQYNVQSGKQRAVRRMALEPKWKGAGPDPKHYKGPNSVDRKTFGGKIVHNAYCVVGADTADEVKKCGKLIRGTLGPFGSGLYFYDQKALAIQMAKDRSSDNRGYLVSVKLFVGQQHDVTNLDDRMFDFSTLQKMSYDSVSRKIAFGRQFIVYNCDQVCIVNVKKST
eukprot:CAMPEP_0202687896 /NCGR_PEP_ID=MMETSP1385-20130828/3457_1 /ASSEMBLY_ACC=CAM_ASM_000861 /TAXON_ID=933848 /ORGANISM="Elphidium margaritaceum" /LENGTH=985 /DNA_ID=CAMNT_0049342749 /DNA_START=104 /DNA_END=3061 /DNA_ORIENTATION=-